MNVAKSTFFAFLCLFIIALKATAHPNIPPETALIQAAPLTNSPTLLEIGRVEGNFAWSAVVNRHLYLASVGENTLHHYDLSNPAAPLYQGEVLTNTSGYPLNTYTTHQGNLYLAYSSFVEEVTLANPAAPVVTRRFQTPFTLYRGTSQLVAEGDYLYGSGETLATSNDRPYFFAIHLPTATVHTLFPLEQSAPCHLVVSKRTLLCDSDVYTVSEPLGPQFAYTLPNGVIHSCATYLDYPYLYTHNNEAAQTSLYQLGQPAGAQLLTAIPATQTVETLLPWGDQLLRIGTPAAPAADWLDIGNLTAPTPNGATLPLAVEPCAEAPQLAGPYLYLNDGSAFRILESDHTGYARFLPFIHREACPPFLEDFSTTANGWEEGGIFVVEYGYTNQEYFLRALAPNFNVGVPMPLPCSSENIDATVTGRWLAEDGAGFGIQFGPALTQTLYYDFQVNPNSGTYRVLVRTSVGVTTFIEETPTPALQPGMPATLRVLLNNGVVTLYVNEAPLEEFDYFYAGPIRLGLSVATHPTQISLPIEARFDDVRVYLP